MGLCFSLLIFPCCFGLVDFVREMLILKGVPLRLLILYVSIGSVFSNLCPEELSIELKLGDFKTNKSGLVFQNILYPPDTYWEQDNGTYRLCVCTKLTCWRKCCPEGEAFVSVSDGWKCAPSNSSLVHPFKIPGVNDDEDSSNYILPGPLTCKKFPFIAENDGYEVFFANGSLRTYQSDKPDIVFDYNFPDYCWEVMSTVGKPDYIAPSLCWCHGDVESPTTLIDQYLTDIVPNSTDGENEVSPTLPTNAPNESLLLISPLHKYIGLIPIIFVTITIAVFIYTKPVEQRGWTHWQLGILACLSSLLISFIFSTLNQLQVFGPLVKIVLTCLAFIAQYSYLEAFFWLNALSFKIWSATWSRQHLSARLHDTTMIGILSLYAVVLPLIICIFTTLVKFDPSFFFSFKLGGFDEKKHILLNKMAKILSYTGPAGILMPFNLVLLVNTALNMFRISGGPDEKRLRRLVECVNLFVVLGVCWIGEMLSWYLRKGTTNRHLPIAEIFNTLACIYLFLLFVCSHKTIDQLVRKMNRRRQPRQRTEQLVELILKEEANIIPLRDVESCSESD